MLDRFKSKFCGSGRDYYESARPAPSTASPRPVFVDRITGELSVKCPDCGFSFVETLPRDRHQHRKYHDGVVFGLKRSAITQIKSVSSSGANSVRLVNAGSPRAHRRVAQELSLIMAGDVEFSFVAYHADEPDDDRHYQIFIGTEGDRAVSYLILERRHRVWRCTWEEYDSQKSTKLPAVNGVWSVGMAWVCRANRKKGWIRRSLDAAAQHLDFTWDRLGWYTPFSSDGEGLARHLCPRGILIAK